MSEIVNNLQGKFIGTVVGYDKLTREVDVFIPKLMPAVPDGQKDMETKTNFGNNSINIKYNDNITISSSIRLRSKDKDAPIPDIGSKVGVEFLEGSFRFGFWEKFNPNGDFNIIEEEKYKHLFKLKIGGKEFELEEEDLVEIELPSGFKVNQILVPDITNPDIKIKKIKISQDEEMEERVTKLENLVGNDEMLMKYEDNDGNEKTQAIIASGLYKKIRNINNKVSDVVNLIGSDGLKYSYTEILSPEYNGGKEYFVLVNGEHLQIDFENMETQDEREQYILSLMQQGLKIFTGTITETQATGIYERLQSLETRLKKLENR